MTVGADVTLWHIPLPDKSPGPEAWALLDGRERQRAEKFIHDRDRHRFVAAHAGLRLALAAETGQPPRALNFTTTPGGKPQLESAMRCPSTCRTAGPSPWWRPAGEAPSASMSRWPAGSGTRTAWPAW